MLLFIYINHIQCAVTDAKSNVFADVTDLFLHGKSLTELENTENDTLNQLSYWMAGC